MKTKETKDYDNGLLTRRLILDACKALYYEKGFRGTSYQDICNRAHVIRSSIYYHFKDKENVRYEVMWEYYMPLHHYAESLCDVPHLAWSLSMYIMWIRMQHDVPYRKFLMEYYHDYPIYKVNASFCRFYQICYERMYSDHHKLEFIDPLAFSSMYGFISGLMGMLDENPDGYDVRALFRHCMISGLTIWQFSAEEISAYWDALTPYIDKVDIDTVLKLSLV